MEGVVSVEYIIIIALLLLLSPAIVLIVAGVFSGLYSIITFIFESILIIIFGVMGFIEDIREKNK